jgi:hypothetical protein
VKGRASEKPSSEDIVDLLDEIEKGGTESFKPARILVEAAERHPKLVAKQSDRLASVLSVPLPPLVRQQLYDVALEIELSSPESLSTIVDSAEDDLINGDATTREYVYRILKIATNEGINVGTSCLEALVSGIAVSPTDTPATVAMDAYVAIVTKQDTVGNEELAPLIDFVESDFPKVRSAAAEALVRIINTTAIKPGTNTDGIRITLENYDSDSLSGERIADALHKL